jgi:small-conductance mechanosensitive channel
MTKKKAFGFNFWHLLSNFWSALFFVLIIVDFIYNNAFSEILEVVGFIYVGVLAVYVGNKEFERWCTKHESRHPGEWFVVIWTGLIAFLLIATLLFHKEYKLPSAVISSYVAVLTILVVTERSKSLYKKEKRRR